MSNQSHIADDSYIGFVFQGLYALIVLLDADDDEAIEVETSDDVVLVGQVVTLHQLKHSLGIPSELTVKNDGFWKTLGIWMSSVDDSSIRFIFVTCAPLFDNNVLFALTSSKTERFNVMQALTAEAERVATEVKKARNAKEPLPYKDRRTICEQFLKLKDEQKLSLLQRCLIKPDNFDASEINTQVEQRLRNFISPNIRRQVVERLIEWWDRQITLTLVNQRHRRIFKQELQDKLSELIAAHRPDALPDDYSTLKPHSVSEYADGVMKKQIDLVRGGDSRFQRALLACWRARRQRERWMTDDISIATTLAKYDEMLIEKWSDRHGPMSEDCCGMEDSILCSKGLDLLDWSHNEAFQYVTPIKPTWQHAFLVQGTYQQLADELRVGWHPNYLKEIMRTDSDEDEKC